MNYLETFFYPTVLQAVAAPTCDELYPEIGLVLAVRLYASEDKCAPWFFPYFWPLTYQSAPQWIAIFVVLMSWWVWDFVGRRSPSLVDRVGRARHAKIHALQEAAVKWHGSETKSGRPGLPAVSQLLDLLWDECTQERTDASRPLEHTAAIEQLLRQAVAKQLRKTSRLTREARFGDAGEPEEGEPPQKASDHAKAVAEAASGEKLSEEVATADDVVRHLGAAFVDAPQLAQAKALLQRVYRAQSTKREQLLRLIRPALPYMLVGAFAAMVNCSLRGTFHSIGGWANILELAAEGKRNESMQALFALWLGHMVIECIERVDASYINRARTIFTRRIKDGVLSAMLSQDYEYFDKNEPGVLQARLGRDSTELGQNLVTFPQEMIHRLSWMLVNVVMIVGVAPTELLLPAFAPLLVTVPIQYWTFSTNRTCDKRQSKAEERAIASTSEVLREIKTVRQFAMEPAESCRHAESEGHLAFIEEQMTTRKQLTDWFFWSIFVCGLFTTMYAGIDYVESGEMKVSALLDIVFRINCHISFPLRAIIDDIPKMTKLLRPLGRICDLLVTNPRIEPGSLPSYVLARDAAELASVLACCDVVEPPKAAAAVAAAVAAPSVFTVLARPLPRALLDSEADPDGGGGGARRPPKRGAHVTALVADDGDYVRVHDKESALLGAPLAFPVRVVFSKGLRPRRFRGKIEFRDVRWSPPTDNRKMVLNGLSFVVEPGQKVALVGPTGCGKSSSMGLLQRLYEPVGGEILVDDIPIGDYDVHYLRSRIVIVDQSTVLFNNTIKANICYGLPYTPSDEEVEQACRDAKAWEFIKEKPDGLLTAIRDASRAQ